MQILKDYFAGIVGVLICTLFPPHLKITPLQILSSHSLSVFHLNLFFALFLALKFQFEFKCIYSFRWDVIQELTID